MVPNRARVPPSAPGVDGAALSNKAADELTLLEWRRKNLKEAATGKWCVGPVLRLGGRRMVLSLGLLASACFVVQLALGVSAAVLALAVITTMLGLVGFSMLGAYNAGAWLALMYVLGNIVIPLYAKTFMGQSLGSFLRTPTDSFFVVAISTAELLAALMIVRSARVGSPLLKSTGNARLLGWLSWGSFILGVVFWGANQAFQGPGGSGFGGLAVFRDLLIMAVIARTALLLDRSGDSRSLDSKLAIILVVGVLLGLLSNSKTQVVLPVIGYFTTLIFYRCGLPWRQVVFVVVGGIFFVTILTPMVQAWRYLGQQQMPVNARIDLMTRATEKVLEHGDLSRYHAIAKKAFQGGYYDYFGGDGRGQMILGRYASIQQIDPVIAEVNRQGLVGGKAIWPAFIRLLPRFIDPDKPIYVESYHILVDLGLINPAGGKYPTLPLAGQAYAGYGLLGVVLIPFLTFLCFLLVLKKLGWSLYRNVYAIFFFCEFIVVYANQGSFGQYVGAVLRSFPLFVLTFWLLGLFSRVRLSRRPERTRLVQISGGV